MLLKCSNPRSDSRGYNRQVAALVAPAFLALMLSGCGGGSSTTTPPPATPLTHYSYADLGAIGPTGTHAMGISDTGVITGYFNTGANGGGPNIPFRHTGTTPIVAADAVPLPEGIQLGSGVAKTSTSNAAGTFVGTAFSNNPNSGSAVASVQNAFLYDTSYHDLSALPIEISGRSSAVATALNDAGTVVGFDDFYDRGLSHAFRHTGTGPLTAADDLGTFSGYPYVRATGINQSGVIVGTGTRADGVTQHAFIYDTGYHDLGTFPGGSNSLATGINRSGVVIGYGYSGTVFHSFRHVGTGPLTASDDIGQLPDSFGLVAFAINAGGDVVGGTGQQGGTASAFVLKAGGTLQSLSSSTLVTNLPAGFTLQTATGINSRGQIVGYTNVTGGVAHAWVLTPTS